MNFLSQRRRRAKVGRFVRDNDCDGAGSVELEWIADRHAGRKLVSSFARLVSSLLAATEYSRRAWHESTEPRPSARVAVARTHLARASSAHAATRARRGPGASARDDAADPSGYCRRRTLFARPCGGGGACT